MPQQTLPKLLSKANPDQRKLAYAGAVKTVRGFQKATEKHGSLLQTLVRGKAVVALEHYPSGDVVDPESGAQYFYHSHRSEQSEHGHLHLFWHADSLGRRVRRQPLKAPSQWSPSHLFAIGFNDQGMPVSVFTTNWWVTEGHWFDCAASMCMLDRFKLSERGKTGPMNRFLNGFLTLYQPLLAQLFMQRDRRIEKLTRQRPWSLVRIDERYEVLSHFEIDWLADIEALESMG